MSELERGTKAPRLDTVEKLVETGLGMRLPFFFELCERARAGDPLTATT